MAFRIRKRLGDLLVDQGVLNRDAVEKAVECAAAETIKLGQYLVREGVVPDSAMADLLSKQLKVERYVPVKYPTYPGLKDSLPLELALKDQVVPLAKSDHLLMLGMTDPADIGILDRMEQMTRCEVDAVLCTEREINQLMTSVYGVGMGIGGILGSMDMGEDAPEPAELLPEENIEVSSLVDMAEGAPVVRMVNMIIAQAVRESASDIHISPEKHELQLRYRVDGKLRVVPAPPMSMMLAIVSRIKVLARMDISVSRIPQDGRFTMRVENREINIRASAIPTINGENIVLRLLDMSAAMYTLDTLGMSALDQQRIEHLITRPYGMMLSTGPTGSGKSTSLYAILQRLNTPDLNIITVEDPVEYRVPNVRQLQLNTRAGMTFASGLRSILRQDPDIIMVGEIRDAETANIAVQASLTGHRVLSTVHTNDSVGAITRLIDMGIEPFLVSSVLMTSFAQRLMRRTCPFCKERSTPSPEALRYLDLEKHAKGEFFTGKGCDNCSGTGFAGRVGIFEVLVIDEDIKGMISRSASVQEIVTYARKETGMKTLKEDAAQKVLEGTTTVEEALATVFV